MNNLTCHHSNNEYHIIQDILFQNNNSDLTPPDWFNQYQENEPTADPYAPDFSFLGGQTAEQFLSISREMAEFGQLGNITKSSSTNKSLQRYTSFLPSDFHYIPVNIFIDDKENRRKIRYQMQQISQHIMPKNHRINSCLRYRITKDENVKIFQHIDNKCLNYGNLMRCGSVWLCPVCSAKISEQRRLELQKAKDNWLSQGGFVYMLTLTTPHYSHTDLKMLLDSQAKALKNMWGGRWAEQFKKELNMLGMVRAFEITQSDKNGFHPHYHILLFIKKSLENDKDFIPVAKQLTKRWQESCVSVGIPKPSDEHGCKLQDGSKAVEYITKFGDDSHIQEFSNSKQKIKVFVNEKDRWNSSHEMTKSNFKTGKSDSLTPFDFLRKFDENPQKYGDLFRIYADATRGKAQLFWSRGLKKALLIDEVTDQAAADNPNISELVGDNNDLAIINSTQKRSEIVYEINEIRWDLVRKHKKQHLVLMLCKTDLENNTDHLTDFLDRLVDHEIAQLEQKLKESSPPRPKKKPIKRRFN